MNQSYLLNNFPKKNEYQKQKNISPGDEKSTQIPWITQNFA